MTTYDTDLDAVAGTALSIISDVREIDPLETLAAITELCEMEPGRMAQVCMALAIWIDADCTPATLADRAEAVARGQVARIEYDGRQDRRRRRRAA